MRKTKSTELHKFREVFLALCKASRIVKERERIEKKDISQIELLRREDELLKKQEDLKKQKMNQRLMQERTEMRDADRRKMILLMQEQLKILENGYNKIKKAGKYKQKDLDRIELKINLIKRKLKGL